MENVILYEKATHFSHICFKCLGIEQLGFCPPLENVVYLVWFGCIEFLSSHTASARALSLQVDDNKKLGEWVGLCKIDREGKPRKVVGCSCVVVKVSEIFHLVYEFQPISSSGKAPEMRDMTAGRFSAGLREPDRVQTLAVCAMWLFVFSYW